MRRKILVALLAATLTVGAFTGCGNKMEGDGKVQAAMADAGNGNSLATETPKSVSGATTEPTAEPTPKATAEPTAEPVTTATTVQTTNAQTSNQQPVASAKTADTVESYTSEFLELLNADRRAAGLSEVSGGADYLEAQALKRAVEATSSPTLSLGGGASWESMGTGADVNVAYEVFKATESTWNSLMAPNLDSVSIATCGNMWVLEGRNGVIIDNGTTVAGDSTSTSSTDDTTDEGSDVLEQISSSEGTETYGTSGVTVLTPEEVATQNEELGWDW